MKIFLFSFFISLISFGYVLIFVFASSVGIPIDITSFALGLSVCATAAGIKRYNSFITENETRMIT